MLHGELDIDVLFGVGVTVLSGCAIGAILMRDGFVKGYGGGGDHGDKVAGEDADDGGPEVVAQGSDAGIPFRPGGTHGGKRRRGREEDVVVCCRDGEAESAGSNDEGDVRQDRKFEGKVLRL